MKKGMAILAYFGILFLIPLFAAKNDPFARYHTNQGLVLFIFMVIFNILSNVLTNILIEISPMLTLIVSGVFGILTPVSYTHLDVYKRQVTVGMDDSYDFGYTLRKEFWHK